VWPAPLPGPARYPDVPGYITSKVTLPYACMTFQSASCDIALKALVKSTKLRQRGARDALVSNSVCQAKSANQCLCFLLTSHVRQTTRVLQKHILCLAVKVRGRVLVQGLEGIVTRPAERIRQGPPRAVGDTIRRIHLEVPLHYNLRLALAASAYVDAELRVVAVGSCGVVARARARASFPAEAS